VNVNNTGQTGNRADGVLRESSDAADLPVCPSTRLPEMIETLTQRGSYDPRRLL
jgi:hypothetical protein